MTEKTVTIELRQQRDYQFEIDFGDGVPTLLGDEPPPLGAGRGPSPVQLLCAAVGNCLSDSLLFALRKYKQQPEPLACEVQAQIGRNEQGRLRVLSMTARLALDVTMRTSACGSIALPCRLSTINSSICKGVMLA